MTNFLPVFRGKTLDGRWVEWDLLWKMNPTIIVTYWEWYKNNYSEYVVLPETIWMSTGKTDKNGKMIFWWDIVKDSDDKVYKVEWCEITASFVFQNQDDEDYNFVLWQYEDNGEYSQYVSSSKDLEIIGNTTDNSDLIQ